MTEDHDEIRDIGDIPEYETNELRGIVRKVLDNHYDEFIDGFVVSVYGDLKRPLTSTAFNVLFQEEVPQEEIDALVEEGMSEFFGDREPKEEERDRAIEYSLQYALVALSMRYPWLLARKKRGGL